MTHTEKVLQNAGLRPQTLTANDGSQFIGWSTPSPTPRTIIVYFTYDDTRQSRDVTNWPIHQLQDLEATTTNILFIYS